MRDGTVVRAPHPALRGLVTGYHGYRYADGPPGLHRGLPSSELTVVLALDAPLDVAWLGDDASRSRHWAMVSGLHAAPAAIRHDGFQAGVQLGFTPAGARALLGLPAGPLSGQLVGLRDLLGAPLDRMYDELAAAATWAEGFDVLDRHLLARTERLDPAPVRPELRRAWRAVLASRGRTPVRELAAELGWSRRHLTELFTREFGVGPKELARVARFQHARNLLARPARLSGSRTEGADAACSHLAAVAVEAGYADQAHLTREWNRLAGCPPTTWLREELPFVQDEVRRAASG